MDERPGGPGPRPDAEPGPRPSDDIPVYGTPPTPRRPRRRDLADEADGAAPVDARRTFVIEPEALPRNAEYAMLVGVLVWLAMGMALGAAPEFSPFFMTAAATGILTASVIVVYGVVVTRRWRAERFEVTPEALVHTTHRGTRRVPWAQIVQVHEARTGAKRDRSEWRVLLDDGTVIAMHERVEDRLDLVRLIERHAGPARDGAL